MYIPTTEEERKFIESYDVSKYEKPSVTADVVIFTLSDANELSLLLIKRGGFPYKDKWAIPGGFVGMKESIDDAAKRELEEETALRGISIEQFGTFGSVDRDPRMRVISVAYMAFVPKDRLDFKAGDDAQAAELFTIRKDVNGLIFEGETTSITESELAFDHKEIIRTALQRLRNRIDYTEDAFKFLKDSKAFTIYELKCIYETVKGIRDDNVNFRRDFIRDYVNTGIVKDTGKKIRNVGCRAATLYCKVK